MQRERLAVLIITVSLVAMALVGVAVVSPIGADQPADSADRTITVSAFGEADSATDRAVIRVAVTSTGDDSAAVRDDLSAGADSLREGLESIGLTDEDYETTEYRIAEERRRPEPERGEADETPTYRGVHAFEVRLDDPDRVGEVIDAAADSGAEIGNIQFTLSDERRDELREEAIANAMNDARTQADAIATNGELTVTGVQHVDASQRHFSPVRHELAAEDGDAAAAETTIDTGDVSVRYDVQVTYNATAGSE